MKKRTPSFMLIAAAMFTTAINCHYSDRGRFTTEPEFTNLARTVSGTDLHSKMDPPVTLRFDSSLRFLGGQKFILYGMAETEQYFFAATGDSNRLTRLFWIQFESYLPDKSGSYDYDDSPLRVTLGDYMFFTDTDIVEFDPYKKRAAGTDGAMVRRFLAEKGMTLPLNWAYARMVYLTNETKRKELMIIVIDDLTLQGVSASEVLAEGPDSPLRREVTEAHLEKIRRSLTVLPFND